MTIFNPPYTMRRLTFLLLVTVLLAATAAACAPAEPPPDPIQAFDPSIAPYPLATRIDEVPDAYPAGQRPTPIPLPPTLVPGSYPIDDGYAEPRFAIDVPLNVGDTVVAGQALPDLLVAAIDITYGGVPLGTARTDADGRFTITTEPLLENHTIGLALAELPAGQSADEAIATLFDHRSDNARTVPNIGFFFDVAVVNP